MPPQDIVIKRWQTCEKPLVCDKSKAKKGLLLSVKWGKIYLKVEQSGGKWNEVVGESGGDYLLRIGKMTILHRMEVGEVYVYGYV